MVARRQGRAQHSSVQQQCVSTPGTVTKNHAGANCLHRLNPIAIGTSAQRTNQADPDLEYWVEKVSCARHLFDSTFDLVDEDVFVGWLQWRQVEMWVGATLGLEIVFELNMA